MKCPEIESELVFARGWGRRELGATINEYWVSSRGDENVLELEQTNNNGYTILWIC